MIKCLQKYDFNITYKKGTMYLAETLPHAYLRLPNKTALKDYFENVRSVEDLDVQEN